MAGPMPSDRFILSSITGPADLAGLSYGELEQLATEIRAMILATVSETGGHLASSLGAVEIILALHRVLGNPADDIVFDVGHQALAHKLLTGRLDRMSTLRQMGGISGFPRRAESPYDVHDSGHASDSLSIAMGLLLAKKLNGDDSEVAVVIGDASVSGGMAFEALNQIGQEGRNLIIVLNDNEMSISKNVGAISLYLGKIRLSKRYTRTRDSVEDRIDQLGSIGHAVVGFGETMKSSVKKVLVGGTLFEDMGITYIGPIDGHDLRDLEDALRAAKHHDGPVLIHAVTKKGKGYGPAEADPSAFHGIAGFDIESGAVRKVPGSSAFTKTFSKLMVAEARRNPGLVAITAAMTAGTGLTAFEDEFPDRFFDVGISEEHAVALAAGLAIGGKTPVVAIYSTFMQRAFDQLVTNVALQDLHVVLCLDRAGLVGRDGSTHHGLFDLAYLRMMPNMTILAPSTTEELAGAFKAAVHEVDGPVAIRYPRFGEGVYEPRGDEPAWEHGKAVTRRKGDDVTILAIGRMVKTALQAAEILSDQGVECEVVDMRWVKPMDTRVVRNARSRRLIVSIEDGIVAGGFADAVLEELGKRDAELCCQEAPVGDDGRLLEHPPLLRMGIDDTFVQHGSEEELFDSLGLSPAKVAQRILDALEGRDPAGC